MKVKLLNRVRAYQAPPSVGFSRQEYWSGVLTREQILTIMHTSPPTEKKYSRNVEYSLNIFKCEYGVFGLFVHNFSAM